MKREFPSDELRLLIGVVRKDDVVSKPFRIPELIPKIEELVARHGPVPVTPERAVSPLKPLA